MPAGALVEEARAVLRSDGTASRGAEADAAPGCGGAEADAAPGCGGAEADAAADCVTVGATPVVVLCGNGNNGGDGWVAAEYLDQWGVPVRIVAAKAPEELTAEPARTAALRARDALSDRSAIVVAPDDAALAAMLADAPLAIDAILGTGFAHDAVKAPFDGWIRALNAARACGTVVVAADVPSGLSAETGSAAADTVRADLTVTMIVPKPGLLNDAGAPWCGRVRVAPLAYIEPLLA